MNRHSRHVLTAKQITRSADFIAHQQQPDGEIPWERGGKSDPWDHVHAAMGLAVAGRLPEAKRAFRYLADTQDEIGGWPAERQAGRVVNGARETNHAAYVATGLWYLQQASPDQAFLAEMWPMIDRAIDFVVSMQDSRGAISWAVNDRGRVWGAPLITGSSSIHGSLVCALRIAETLGHARPHWQRARRRLASVLQHRREHFDDTDLPNRPGRYSMDWYYPVLGGAVRGLAAWRRLFHPELTQRFVTEGVGCRCVDDRPWYTVAESGELVLALDAVGLTLRARQILDWLSPLRTRRGGYWTGRTHPDGELYPHGEQTAWTAATVLLADDAVARESTTSAFFRDLASDGHVEPEAHTVMAFMKPSTSPRPEVRQRRRNTPSVLVVGSASKSPDARARR